MTAPRVAKFVGLTLALLAAPLVGETQPGRRVPRVVLLMPGAPTGAIGIGEFREGLATLGYVEGQNVIVEIRWEEDKPERWPAVVNDVLRLGVEVIVSGRGAATRAAHRATATVPIVSATLGDPVQDGLAESLARPGRNVTGLTLLSADLGAKRVDLMKQTLPDLTRAVVMWDAQHTASPPGIDIAEATARTLGLRLQRLGVNGLADLDAAFGRATRASARAVIIAQGALFAQHRVRVAEIALKHRLPAISGETGFGAAGGLMNYGPNIPDNFRRAAGYVDRILKGAKPGDLPIEQPEKFDFAINLKTAKALGLTIPPSVLARATEVIE